MKRKSIIMSVATLAIIAGFAVSTFAAEEKEETTTMDKVPQAVKTTLAKYAAETEVKNVEISSQNGKKVYEFDIEKGGRKFEVAISPKGKFKGTEEDVDFKSIPDAAQKGLTEQANGGTITGCEKAVDAKNKVTYEAEITKDGKKTEVVVDADGKVVGNDAEAKEKGEGKSEGKEKEKE